MNAESMISGIITAVIGLAIVAVIVSKKADTANVLGAGGSSLANVIGAAVSPVSGGNVPITTRSLSTFGGAFN